MRFLDKPFTIPALDKDSNTKFISTLEAVECRSYAELRKYIAQLACGNPDYILFFRGQKEEYPDMQYPKDGPSFFPSIYRGNVDDFEMRKRWRELSLACKTLVDEIERYRNGLGKENPLRRELTNISNRKLVQWSILQHYEVTKTPLLDVTQSLRVACSFACMDNKKEYAYIFVFAIPYYTGRISINSEHEITNIRLLSIAPSESLRPHYQEGFLLGEDQIEHGANKSRRFDFRRRLVGKFKIRLDQAFWIIELNNKGTNANEPTTHFESLLSKEDLYPENDLIKSICEKVKNRLKEISEKYSIENTSSDLLVKFLNIWNNIERFLRNIIGSEETFAPIRAISRINDVRLRRDLNGMRVFRNKVVHGHVENDELEDAIGPLYELESRLIDYSKNL